MLALQLRGPDSMMGLAYDGTFQAAVAETVAERVARIRAKMVSVGIPASFATGIFTTLTFAGAFGLARTERVWLPSLLLGGVATLAALASTAVAATSVNAAAAPAATTTASTAPAAAAPAAAAPAAFGYY